MGVSSRKVRVIFEVSKRFSKDVVAHAIGNAPNLIQREQSVTIIQRWFRGVWAAHLAREVLLQAVQVAREKKVSLVAVKQIQSCYRYYQEKRRRIHLELKRRETAAIAISSMMRWKLAVLLVEKIRHERIRQHQCGMAITIQCFLRVSVAKDQFFRRKEESKISIKAGVLQRFFKEILRQRAERRKLENECASIIQNQVLAHTNRRDFTRMRSAAMSIQKTVRGHQARRIIASNILFNSAEMSESDCGLPTEQESFEHSAGPPSDELACDRSDTLENSGGADEELVDYKKFAIKIQTWYRKKQETRLAVRKFLALKKAGEENERRRIISERNETAATRIQALLRMHRAHARAKARCRVLIDELTAEIAREFNDSWKISCIEPEIKPEETINKIPVIRSGWLRTIPKGAHPTTNSRILLPPRQKM